MFRTRLISGIFLVVTALAVIIAGGPVLGCALLFCAVVGMQELYRAAGVVSAGSSAYPPSISNPTVGDCIASVYFLPAAAP